MGPSTPKNIARCPPFNDAPLDLLSVNLTGREQEIALIIEFLNNLYGDVPARSTVMTIRSIQTAEAASSTIGNPKDSVRETKTVTTVTTACAAPNSTP